LIPPAPMLEYVEGICGSEGVNAEPGVLPMVVRAGGGSARDTLSLLDQLIAGTDGTQMEYELATQLLGFTSAGLLNDVISAFASGDAAEAYGAVDAVIQSGQDPRRFVEDLLERVRDFIIVRALGESSGSVLRGAAPEDLEQMRRSAGRFSPQALSQMADAVNDTLTEMSGVTTPRVQLELMVARILVAMRAEFGGGSSEVGSGEAALPSGPASQPEQAAPRSTASRADTRATGAPPAATTPSTATTPSAATTPPTNTASNAPEPAPSSAPSGPAAGSPDVPQPASPANPAADAAAAWDAVAPAGGATAPTPAGLESQERASVSADAAGRPNSSTARSSVGDNNDRVMAPADPVRRSTTTDDGQQPSAADSVGSDTPVSSGVDPATVDLGRIRAAWPEVIEQVARIGQASAAAVVKQVEPIEYEDGKLRVELPNRGTSEQLRRGSEQQNAPGQHLKAALQQVFGFEIMIYPRVRRADSPAPSEQGAPPADPERHRAGSGPTPPAAAAATSAPDSASAAPVRGTGAGPTPAAAAPDLTSPVPSEPASSGSSGPASPASDERTSPAPSEPTSPAPDAKVATWDVVAIPGSEDGPGSGWDKYATETNASQGGATDPGPARSGVAEPGASVSGATEPGTARSGITRPGTAQDGDLHSATSTTGSSGDRSTNSVPAVASSSDSASQGSAAGTARVASPQSQAPERIPEVIAAKEAAVLNQAPGETASANSTAASTPKLAPVPPPRHPALVGGVARYGESVIRERLGARFVGEELIEEVMAEAPMDPADIPPDDFEAPPEEY
ncbi:MAG: hypothetical protein ACTHXA_13305, partial [Gulosibacter sp.]|uniref:hypothetical protein n=1 Tax=Gulosibacter sp. TaxID=2817531 RepID=UPI003F8F21BD